MLESVITRPPAGGVIFKPDAYTLCRRRSRLLSLEVYRESGLVLRQIGLLTTQEQSLHSLGRRCQQVACARFESLHFPIIQKKQSHKKLVGITANWRKNKSMSWCNLLRLRKSHQNNYGCSDDTKRHTKNIGQGIRENSYLVRRPVLILYNMRVVTKSSVLRNVGQ